MLKFRRITVEDFEWIRTMVLRKEDIRELRASTGFTNPYDALRYSIFHSNEWTEVCYDVLTMEIISLFGLASSEGIGIPWMVASPKLKQHKQLLMTYSRKVFQRMLKQFSLLNNYVDSRNKLHIHWLKRMGFQFNPEFNTVMSKIPFLYFYKIRRLEDV